VFFEHFRFEFSPLGFSWLFFVLLLMLLMGTLLTVDGKLFEFCGDLLFKVCGKTTSDFRVDVDEFRW